MSKYIDVERYINNLRKLRTGDKDTVYEYYDDGIDVAISEAAIFPAADVVEVVRCKDCKYQDKGENDCEAWNLCGYRPWLHYPVQDEHYCGYGKRKD